MDVLQHQMRGAQTIAPGDLDASRLNVVRGRGRGNVLQLPAGWITLIVVLSGTLELDSHDATWALGRGRCQLWLEGALRCAGHGHGWWLLLTAPPQAWDPGGRRPVLELLPWEAPCQRSVLRPIVRLARRPPAGDASPASVAGIVADLRQAVVEQQAELQGCLARCSGRTRVRRRQSLLRLLRVQHLIRCHLDEHIALERLGASANYSPCHLLRVYRHVFGETPNEYASRLRRQRAWELVRDTPTPVCEIAGTLGFESESAFCRAFKHSFGCTTSAVRRRVAAESQAGRTRPASGSGSTSISALSAR